MSGPLKAKEKPIDLLYVLLPRAYSPVPFILERSRARSSGIDKQLPMVKEVPLQVILTAKQRKMYVDFLVEPDNQVSWSLHNKLCPIRLGEEGKSLASSA